MHVMQRFLWTYLSVDMGGVKCFDDYSDTISILCSLYMDINIYNDWHHENLPTKPFKWIATRGALDTTKT